MSPGSFAGLNAACSIKVGDDVVNHSVQERRAGVWLGESGRRMWRLGDAIGAGDLKRYVVGGARFHRRELRRTGTS